MLFDRIETLTRHDIAVFIGYDPKEHDAAEVLAHSLRRHNPGNFAIVPLIYDELRAYGFYDRPLDPKGSTQFSMSRFVVPKLAKMYDVKAAVFMDCDMLVTAPFTENMFMEPVNVCMHNYIPRYDTKMDNKIQEAYQRKNWSSFVCYNMESPELAPLYNNDYLNNASPADLHRFRWIDDNLIGSLPLSWNYLVGETDWTPLPATDEEAAEAFKNKDTKRGIHISMYNLEEKELPKNIHYTLGTPDLPLYNDCQYNELWFDEYYLLHGKQHSARTNFNK